MTGRGDYQPRDAVYAELARDHIQTGSEFILMRRDRRWKIVTYLDDVAGEFYDLQADPDEVNNLWQVEALRALRDELVASCMQWLARGMLSSTRLPGRTPQKAMRI